jgi:hypothetical protein
MGKAGSFVSFTQRLRPFGAFVAGLDSKGSANQIKAAMTI